MPSSQDHNFYTSIIPFLNTLDFTVSNINESPSESRYYEMDGLFFSVAFIDSHIAPYIAMSVSNVKNGYIVGIPCCVRYGYVYLKSRCGLNIPNLFIIDKYCIWEYGKKKFHNILCLHCEYDVSIRNHRHYSSKTHKANVINYNQNIKNVLLQSGRLNDNVLTEILSFL